MKHQTSTFGFFSLDQALLDYFSYKPGLRRYLYDIFHPLYINNYSRINQVCTGTENLGCQFVQYLTSLVSSLSILYRLYGDTCETGSVGLSSVTVILAHKILCCKIF